MLPEHIQCFTSVSRDIQCFTITENIRFSPTQHSSHMLRIDAKHRMPSTAPYIRSTASASCCPGIFRLFAFYSHLMWEPVDDAVGKVMQCRKKREWRDLYCKWGCSWFLAREKVELAKTTLETAEFRNFRWNFAAQKPHKLQDIPEKKLATCSFEPYFSCRPRRHETFAIEIAGNFESVQQKKANRDAWKRARRMENVRKSLAALKSA